MRWFRKKNTSIDWEKGKKIFYEHNGNTFYIEFDLGDEYEKCNIPKEVENEWHQDIYEKLKREIEHASETPGFNAEKIWSVIFTFLDMNVPEEKRVLPVLQFLDKAKCDTFLRILVCEDLRKCQKYIKSVALNEKVEVAIREQIYIMLSEPITIDDSFKYWRDYDSPDENLKLRIIQLLDK